MMRKRPFLTGVFVVVGLLAVGSGVFAFTIWRSGRALEARMGIAVSDLEGGRWTEARSSLGSLATEAQAFSGRLGGPLGSVVARVPIAGRSVRTARALAGSAEVAATSAGRALPVLENESFWQGGRINLTALRDLRTVAEAERAPLEAALSEVEASPSRFLPWPLARSRAKALKRLTGAIHGLDVAVRGVDLADRVLGAEGERRYFIIFENLAEMRGTGGFWGNYGILIAKGGKLSLGRFGRPKTDLAEFVGRPGPQWFEDRYGIRFAASREWTQMGTAPDFPTSASIAEESLQSADGIGPVDGTIGLDPVALAALLKVTGPVQVKDWPEPITSENVVRVTLHDAYSHFTNNNQRIAFLGDTALAVWSRFLTADMGTRRLVGSGLGRAIEDKHLRLHFTRPDEQRLANALGAAGGMGDPGKTIGLVTQNVSGNKMDYWLQRSLDVRAELQKDGSAKMEVTIDLKNDGPATGEPLYVIGPYDDRFKPGWNVQFVRLYIPGSSAVQPNTAQRSSIASELGFTVIEWRVEIPPGGTVTRRVSFDVAQLWDHRSRKLDLTLRRQAFLAPDNVHVQVIPPWGRRIALNADESCQTGRADRDVHIDAAVQNSLVGLIAGPWARDAECGTRFITGRGADLSALTGP